MFGDSKVPARGRQTPLSGAIWVPSTDRVKVGLGRKKAVISCAFDSSMFKLSASRVGLLCSNRRRTCSQVRACCAEARWADAINIDRHSPSHATQLKLWNLNIACSGRMGKRKRSMRVNAEVLRIFRTKKDRLRIYSEVKVRGRRKDRRENRREARREERGLRAQGRRKFRVFAARTREPCRLARTRASDRRNPNRRVARFESPHAAGKIVGWRYGRRVPTLQFRAAWRAGRRWPILPGTTKRKHNQERRGTKGSGPRDPKKTAAATTNRRAPARTASRD